ncbi:MAG: sensor histidine kinase [Cellulosilyticaceae bacterium]
MLIGRNNTYKKIFTTYTIVILGIVLILDGYFYTNIVKQERENNTYVNKKITEDVSNYIRELGDTTRLIKKSLYQSNSELTDTLSFLEKDLNDYLNYRLNEFYKSDKNTYSGLEYFMSKTFDLSSYITKISLLSYNQRNLTEFLQNGTRKNYSYHDAIPIEYENHVLGSENTLTFMEIIKKPIGFKEVGVMFVTYDVSAIKKMIGTNTRHRIRILDNHGMVIYDSTGQLVGKLYPHMKNRIINQEELQKVTNWYTNIGYLDQGIMVIGEIDKKDAEHVSTFAIMSLIVLGAIVFIFGEGIVYLKLRNLDHRMQNILVAMKAVTQGNLNAKIEVGRDSDELSIIAKSFNKMCEELSVYIQKSYLAELNQKNAEMRALQSQINPHFLYNTLESIRMKAICNGDREVGKMLYSLAVIFRSQIKEENEITLAKELHYCKKYLELFEFRYENNFNFEIICQEENLRIPVIKFIVQPILENYFVHGIRLEEMDNKISIRVEPKEGDILIIIEDNGVGLATEKINEMNEQLKQCKYDGKSIGITNVHERIVMAYGKTYGVKLDTNRPCGLSVVLCIPNRGGNDDV